MSQAVSEKPLSEESEKEINTLQRKRDLSPLPLEFLFYMSENLRTIARRFGVKSEQFIKAMKADQLLAGREMAKNERVVHSPRR